MNKDFVAEILRATGNLRSGDPAAATDVIQAALAAAGLANGRPDDAAPFHIPGMFGRKAPDGGPLHAGVTGDRLRRPLGEVVRTLAEGRRRLGLRSRVPGVGPDTVLPVPEGAEFRDLHYAGPAGARRYRLYIPASAAGGFNGLVVMLHGCTQNPEDFAAGTGMNDMAEEHRLLIVYPAQTSGHNALSCWNWFRPEDQKRGAGEPAMIAGLTESIRAEFAVPRDRVFIAGLSAGGAMAAIMAETYPDIYAAVGIHSGLAYGSAHDVVSAFGAMSGQAGNGRPQERRGQEDSHAAPRMIVFHGSADATVHPGNAERIITRHAGPTEPVWRYDHTPASVLCGYTRMAAERADGSRWLECWIVDGLQHAWSGGRPEGSYTDPRGPDASAEMVRFFLDGASGG
jgi:poly(hydroxyalkanoate) depolymerase family esterase